MNIRTRRRTTIGEMKGKKKIGFRSKARLSEEAYLEARWRIKTKERVVTEYGYSKISVPSVSSNIMFEDSRLNAVCKVLYREGYFVDMQNYEGLDLDRIESTELINYNFYYTHNGLDNFSYMNRKRKVKVKGGVEFKSVRYVVNRDEKGRFKRVYEDTSLKDSRDTKKRLNS